jgi:hypothetical protein
MKKKVEFWFLLSSVLFLTACSGSADTASKDNESVCTKFIGLINSFEENAAPLERLNQATGGGSRPILSNLQLPDFVAQLSTAGIDHNATSQKEALGVFLQVAGMCLSEEAYIILNNTYESLRS